MAGSAVGTEGVVEDDAQAVAEMGEANAHAQEFAGKSICKI